MNYQKTYMNHIHSSSLLCQLATMWKSQTLCDAVIRSGSNITRAHRVVLVAACPMLQSMESAASGSHLEVRVASDIKVDSIHTFLQYLYEGFMTLTEDNCKDVEKIARLLQVDGVVKCCADFSKCLNTSTAGHYKYSLMDQLEFRHVRTTDLSKCQDKLAKRSADGRISPGGKRQRLQRPSSPPSDHSMSHRAHDIHGMTESYMPDANDPWERVPRISRSQPGVIDIVEDSLELIQTEPPGKHTPDSRRVQQSVGISVASQHNKEANLQVVNISGSTEQTLPSSSRTMSDSVLIPDSPSSSSSSSFKESSGVSRTSDRGPPVQPPPQLQRMDPNRQQSHGMDQNRQQQGIDPNRQPSHGTINLVDMPQSPEHDISKQTSGRQPARSNEAFQQQQSPHKPFPEQSPHKPFPVSLTAVPRPAQSFQSKPFAAGSVTQAESPRGQRSQGSDRASPADRSQDTGLKGRSEVSESGPDISIIKVEQGANNMASDSIGGLDMYVSEGGVSLSANQNAGQGEEEEHSDYELEEPPGDASREGEMSMEGGDQSANWFMGNVKDFGASFNLECTRPRPGVWRPDEAAKLGMRELAPGSSVYVYEDEYINALSKIKISDKTNKKDGTPAARYLLSVFYTSSELVNATIRNDGDDPSRAQGPYVPLNKTIIYAIEDVVKTEPGEMIVVKEEPQEEIVTVPWHNTQPEASNYQTAQLKEGIVGQTTGQEGQTSGQLGQTTGQVGQTSGQLGQTTGQVGQTGDEAYHSLQRREHQGEDVERIAAKRVSEEGGVISKDNQQDDQAHQGRPRRHPLPEPTEKRSSLYTCTECYEVFEDSTELRLHMNNIHNRDTTYVIVCEFCDKKFKTSNGYLIHKDRYHNNAEKYPKCTKCGKNFASASSLETHMITHTKQKTFTCLTCNKSFKFKGTLKSHKCEPK